MTQQDEQRPTEDTSSPDETIERLLRLAGPRQPVDAECASRVRGPVREVWQASVRRRTRVRRWTIGGVCLVVAAGVLFGVAVARRVAAPPFSRVPAAPAAWLVSATGSIRLTGGSLPTVAVGDAVPIGVELETGADVLATLALTTGGEVRLNQHTVVRFVEARELNIERGGVYLVSGDKDSSVVVRTPAGVIRDVGTRFEVGLVDGIWRVRVREGLVRYERGDARQVAEAGTELRVNMDGSLVKRPAPTYGIDWAWIERAAPTFRVEGQTLAAFLDWAARESGHRIEFASDRIRSESTRIILHGSIEGLGVEEALEVILPTCGLTHRMESQRLIVSQAGSSRRGAP